jgi:hypothetical protein
MGNQTTVVLEVTVWDADKVDALVRKIESDPRVIRVQEFS